MHPVDRTLEYSRPLSALKLWLAFVVHGADGIRAAIERNLEEATLLAGLLRQDARFELLMEPSLSVVCFRRLTPDPAQVDEHNRAAGRRAGPRRADPDRPGAGRRIHVAARLPGQPPHHRGGRPSHPRGGRRGLGRPAGGNGGQPLISGGPGWASSAGA